MRRITNENEAGQHAFVLVAYDERGTDQTDLLGCDAGRWVVLVHLARHPGPSHGVADLNDGLIEPHDKPRPYDGSLESTPVFVGCSDVDAHLPLRRVHETREVFERMGADVTERIYPGMPHTINEDEIAFVRRLLTDLVERRREL